ncbi:divergent PAP2 family protein [Chloroflexota bacterium]
MKYTIVNEFFTNYVIIVPAVSWAVAQVMKTSIILVRDKRWDFHALLSSGGMPSSHSAVVTALATVIALLHGVSSTSFGIAAILATIVMHDAANVRQSVGQQAEVLNHIMEKLRSNSITNLERDLKELIGHTQFQVIIGAIIGILIAWLWITFG